MIVLYPLEEKTGKSPGAIFKWILKIQSSEEIIGVHNFKIIQYLMKLPILRRICLPYFAKRIKNRDEEIYVHNELKYFNYLNNIKYFHLHNDYVDEMRVYEKNLSDCKKIFVCSEFLKKKVQSQIKCDTDIVVLSNGANFSKFKTKKEKNLITFIGRIDENKNPIYFCKLAKELNREKYFIAIASTTKFSFYLAKFLFFYIFLKYIERVDISYKVACTENEIYDLLHQTKYLIVPTQYTEAFNMVAIEGLASRCNVIHSGVGGLSEVISHEPLIKDNKLEPVIEYISNGSTTNVNYDELSNKYSWHKIKKIYSESL